MNISTTLDDASKVYTRTDPCPLCKGKGLPLRGIDGYAVLCPPGDGGLYWVCIGCNGDKTYVAFARRRVEGKI